jgi:hypothetical protein
MRMHHDRPLPSPGPAKIVEFIKRLSESSLVKLSRLLKEEQMLYQILEKDDFVSLEEESAV